MSDYKVGSPMASKKHHLFAKDEDRSLCGKWLYFGEKYGNAFTFGVQKDDCRECAKRYAKHIAMVVLKPGDA